MQSPNTTDYWLLKQLNHWMASSEFFSKQAVLFNSFDLPELIMACVLVYWWFSKKSQEPSAVNLRHKVLIVLFTCFPTYAIAFIIQRIFRRPRPLIDVPLEVPVDFQTTFNNLRETLTGFGSFPSDHAVLVFLFATVAFTVNRRLGITCIFASLYYSSLRVAIGYHWPSDILGGALIGTLVALIVLSLAPRLNSLMKKIVSLAENYPAMTYTFSFVFLSDFSHSFFLLRHLAHAFGKRIFH